MPYTPPYGDDIELGFVVGYQLAPGTSLNLEFDPGHATPDRVRAVGGIGADEVSSGVIVTLRSRWVQQLGGPDTSIVSTPVVVHDNLIKIYVEGIDNHIVVGTPESVSWDQDVFPAAIPAPPTYHPVSRVRSLGGYNPPPPGSVILNWFGEPYAAPPASAVQLEFGALGYGYVWPAMGDVSLFGDASIGFPFGVQADGIAPPPFGLAHVQTSTNELRVLGLNATEFGTTILQNAGVALLPDGIAPPSFGLTQIYNLRQFLTVSGLDALAYGDAYVQGGVKYVAPGGILATLFGQTDVFNPMADRTVSLQGRGIAPSPFGLPSVSPRIVYPVGLNATRFGSHWLQHSPQPYGFNASTYGMAWVEFGLRYVDAQGFDPLETGATSIFDRARKVTPGLFNRSTVFGDHRIANQDYFVHVIGEDHFQGSDWANVESNRRSVSARSDHESLVFGDATIRNRWPTVAPFGFDALRPAGEIETGVGYIVRYLRVSGIPQHMPATGQHVVTKTPSIEPIGFAGSMGGPVIWFRVRAFEFLGWESERFGESAVWFRYRYVLAEGHESEEFGDLRVEHSLRWLEPLGFPFMALGSPKIEQRNKVITPNGIWEDFASAHQVGTDRWLLPIGFDAAKFGTRIIPEIQRAYPGGFANPYGWPSVWNRTQTIHPQSFLSVGQQPADRWGRNVIFNSDQYISLVPDVNDGLHPPAWPLWTLIENRNKALRATGTATELLGRPYVFNNATALHPAGIESPDPLPYYKAGLVAYRIRYLPVEGMEPPYISTWGVVYNDAFVIAPNGYVATQAGQATVENTRRYFPYITGGDMSGYGTPMVADRIRKLEFEGRHTIGAPLIALPRVDLYTRYVAPIGSDLSGIGWASLSIHWKIISPSWTHRDIFGGDNRVWNVTPELRTYGRNAEDFGDTRIRLEWRPVAPFGENTQRFGATKIADRDRAIEIPGFKSGAIGNKLTVVRLGAPPYSTQYIWLDGTTGSGDTAEPMPGNGIPPPGPNPRPPLHPQQVGEPVLNQQVIYVQQDDPSSLYGNAFVAANSIRVEPGYWNHQSIGDHTVTLWIRELAADKFPDEEVFDPSPARIDPHTIWAVTEAPRQAKDNHPTSRPLHFVDYNPYSGVWRKDVGRPTATLRHRTVMQRPLQPGDGTQSSYGRAQIINRRSYVRPEGSNFSRFGNHIFPGTQTVEQFESNDSQTFGRPSLASIWRGPQDIKPLGLLATQWGDSEIQPFNREIFPVGHDSAALGTRKPGDSPFMWQGLRVGPHVPLIIGGAQTEAFGEPWASFRVRGFEPEGFDAFVSEYDLEAFDQRMRVIRVDPPAPFDTITAVGLDHCEAGVPNVRLGVHYIRPDGDAEQFRKGAF